MSKHVANAADLVKRVYEPLPMDGRKNFHGKCKIWECIDGSEYLQSYDTVVMSRDADGTLHRHWNGWSRTTARHIMAAFQIDSKTYKAMPIEPGALPFIPKCFFK